MDLAQVGRQFKADWVIYLEINRLSMYEPGSANQLYRGRASVNVNLVDVSKPDDTPKSKLYVCQYPNGGHPIPVDMDSMMFREKFLDSMARQLAWHFSRYPQGANRMME